MWIIVYHGRPLIDFVLLRITLRASLEKVADAYFTGRLENCRAIPENFVEQQWYYVLYVSLESLEIRRGKRTLSLLEK